MICFQLGLAQEKVQLKKIISREAESIDVQNSTFKLLKCGPVLFDLGLHRIYCIFGEKVLFVSPCYFEINYI